MEMPAAASYSMTELRFSIIIPTLGERQPLTQCLTAMAALDFPANAFELFVVDDGCAPPLDELVEPFRSRLYLTLLRQAHAGPAAARNFGASQARGSYLVFTDDDCRPARDWLRTLDARLTNDPDCAMGGCVVNALDENLYSVAGDLLVRYLYQQYNANPDQARLLISSNVAFPAARFHAIGGFDVSFRRAAAEDRDLCGRWLEHGFRMIYAPEVVVYHRHALQPASFWRKHFNYGRGSYHYHQLHRALGLEPLSFYWNLLWIPLRGGRMPHSLRLCLVLVISQLANASGFAWAGLRQWTQRGVHADDTAD